MLHNFDKSCFHYQALYLKQQTKLMVIKFMLENDYKICRNFAAINSLLIFLFYKINIFNMTIRQFLYYSLYIWFPLRWTIFNKRKANLKNETKSICMYRNITFIIKLITIRYSPYTVQMNLKKDCAFLILIKVWQ